MEGTKSRFVNLQFDYSKTKLEDKNDSDDKPKVLPKLQIIKTSELIDYM